MPTQQFKWIDRDTAARDMLQLVYHAPPQIAEQAVKLLKAVRSPAIIPELCSAFLDSEYDMQFRREMYEIICATPGNFDFSEFEPVISQVFEDYNFYSYAFKLLKYHPTNVFWVIRDIETKELPTQLHIYSNILPYLPELVTQQILKIISDDEGLLTKEIAFRMHQFGGETIQNWLRLHWDRIIILWLTDDINEEKAKYWKRLHDLAYLYEWLNKWPVELKKSLTDLNPDWVLNYLGRENPLMRKLIYIRLLPLAPQTVFTLLLKEFEEKQIFLDLEIAGLLHQYGDGYVQNWLKERWDELIYLCLIDSVGAPHYAEKVRIIHILEKWPELKEALFKNSPSIVEEYNEKKDAFNLGNFEQISDSDIQSSSVWLELKQRHNAYVESDKSFSELGSFSTWETLAVRSEVDIPRIAAEVFFLGTVTEFDHRAAMRLRGLIKEGCDIWRRKEFLFIWDEHLTFSYTPIRFEAAYAWRNLMKPSTWEMFIEFFFVTPKVSGAISSGYGEDDLLRWISRMTDMLSGVEPELPDEELPLNARPWLCALVKQNPS